MVHPLGFTKTFDISDNGVVYIRFLYKWDMKTSTTTKAFIEKMKEVQDLYRKELKSFHLSFINFKPTKSDDWLSVFHDSMTIQLNAGRIEFDNKQRAENYCKNYLEPIGYVRW